MKHALTFPSMFLLGAAKLIAAGKEYGPVQQEAGFGQAEWELLTADRCWSRSERQKIGQLLSNAVSINLNVAGLPPTPLPGAYVAATICKLVHPCNRLVAAMNAPESFDAMSASGLNGEPVEVITTQKQMLSLVLEFSADEWKAIERFPVDKVLAALVEAEQMEA